MKPTTARNLQISLIMAGIVLIVLGVFLGEAMDVMRKASYLCLECIGLG